MPSTLHRRIAANIREHAKRRDMSLNRLADFAGISRRHLARILNGEQSPTVVMLEKIAGALDLDVVDLVGKPSRST